MRNGRVAPPSTLMSVEEVMQAAGVGKNTAYQIIKKLNAELDAMGKLTFRGRVNRKFFEERFGYEGRQS
ncbi:MAG: DNA-binding protein [Selenomonadaceae bacterium]|nr:DNA-binding protein [Selenomonadaceae bacterium]MBQ9615859.1 DNA-binding protein [Selenomonadaceae bacterium]MBR3721721.1 DNA-binding protein [Selenomonadaceae bacterium]MBR4696038.1 DNA-binding protein [Selenomonadaceae bacterium]